MKSIVLIFAAMGVCGIANGASAPTMSASKATTVPQMMPAGHAEIQLSPLSEQLIGVKTGVVEKRQLFKNIEAPGRLAFDPELYTAQTEYTEALQQLERVKNSPLRDVIHSARHMVQSARLRLKILGLSDKQIARLRAGGEGEDNLLLTKPGQQVWIYADIFQMDLPYVHSGQTADITAGFLDGKTLTGKIVSVDRVINPTTQTAKARILVPEGSSYLRPESYVNVRIHVPLGEQVTVPFDAILDTGKQAWVFIDSPSGKITPRLVNVKFYAGNEVAIGSGLSGGEKIVTSANFLIDSESRLKAASEGMGESSGSDKRAALPTCPKGQHWDLSMSMCMAD